MNRFLFPLVFIVFLVVVSSVNAQTTDNSSIVGYVIDDLSGESLVGTSVVIENQRKGVITNVSGKFKIDYLPVGLTTVHISYIGYESVTKDFNLTNGLNDLGVIKLQPISLGLNEVEVIADIAKERMTPVAATTISATYIEQNLGNQEFPEILRNTPSVYVTKEGGGFGDSRINVRGFEQNNIAVMINGVPVNDMETGWVYWSNWSGLADVTNKMQVQRGLGASKLAIPAVGGTINILTNAAEFKKGGNVSSSIGNDGYTKYSTSLSSGLLDNGLAATMQLTHTRGNGYIDGTDFQAYSYFISANYNINQKQRISATITGAPQMHNRRSISNRFDNVFLSTFRCPVNDSIDNLSRGIKFNPGWGYLNGKVFSWRKNFYHKPKAFINHYLNFSSYTKLKTAFYVSTGNGGGTSARGRGLQNDNVDNWSGYDSFHGFGIGVHDSTGQVMFDSIIAYNNGDYVAAFGGYNNEPDTVRDDLQGGQTGDGWIRAASVNKHIWYGAISTLEHNINENLSFVGGIDIRYYVGEHFRKVENLLGNSTYLSSFDMNNSSNFIDYESGSSFGSFSENSYLNNNNLLYHNDGIVKWLGAFGQIEYSNDKFSFFTSLSLSNQGFKRIDYFNYMDNDSLQTTDWQMFNGGTFKTGFNFNVNQNSRVFINTGYFSKQPIFNNIFLNFQNDINSNANNQSVRAFEIGYSYYNKIIDFDLNAYYTEWYDRQYSTRFAPPIGHPRYDVFYLFYGISQTHKGLEAEINVNLSDKISMSGMVSLGDWVYTDNINSRSTILDAFGNFTADSSDSVKILYAKGLKVGDAAQHTYSLTLKFKPFKNFSINTTYYVADELYAPYDILDPQYYEEGGQVTKLPIYGIARIGVYYRRKINDNFLSFRFNVNNLFNTLYLAELNTNTLDENNNLYRPDQPEFYTRNKGYFGFGRTWNFGVKLSF